ncbi:MAG: phosphoribosyltransferase [Chloroflexota bacterium]
MNSYDYANRSGVQSISWDDFAKLVAHLSEQVAALQPEIIVGIARGGLFPATSVACSLRRELYPLRVTRRLNDQVIHNIPVWRVPLSPDVIGKSIVVIDEIADTGQTLSIVAAEARRLGAAQVFTASLVRHTWSTPIPDACPLVTDELVIFPWDQQVWTDGQWQPHPEIAAARRAQGE